MNPTIRTSAVLALVLFLFAASDAHAQDLVITNANPPISVPLQPGSVVAFNNGEGPRQLVPVSGLLAIRAQCVLVPGQTKCLFTTGTNGGVAFSNTFQGFVLQAGAALVLVDNMTAAQTQIQDPRFVDVRCTTATDGKCLGLPQAAPPTVSFVLSNFSAGRNPANNMFPPGIAFTITPDVTNADYCIREQSGSELTGWSGTVFPPFGPVQVSIPGSQAAPSFNLRCFNSSGSAAAMGWTFATGPRTDCPLTAGLAEEFSNRDFQRAFRAPFPTAGSATLELGPHPNLDPGFHEYSRLYFFSPRGLLANGEFSIPSASAQATITLSECAGDFSASLPAACKRTGNASPLKWSTSGDDVTQCRVRPGQVYYLNAAFLDAASNKTCSGFNTCTGTLASTSSLVVTQPFPPLAPGAGGAPAIASATQLGVSTAFGGQVMAVGLPESDQAAGRVFVYRRAEFADEWTFEASLTAQGKAIGDKFGAAVSVSGDGRTIIVGAPLADAGGVDRGSAHVFRIGGSSWTTSTETVFVAADAANGDQYGAAVHVAPGGNAFLIGAPAKDSNTGSAYFRIESAAMAVAPGGKAAVVKTLPLAPRPGEKALAAIGDKFGSALATDSGPQGGRWIIGAPGREIGRGAVRILRDVGGTFVFDEIVVAPGGAAGDAFGSAVAIDGNKFAVGAPGDDVDPQGVDDGNAADDRADQGSLAILEYGPNDARRPIDVLAADVGAIGDRLGSSVAIRSGLALAGGPEIDVDAAGNTTPASGRLAMFQLCAANDACTGQAAKGTASRWRFARHLSSTSTSTGDRFGSSIAFNGSAIVVGAPRRGEQIGAAYVFRTDAADVLHRAGFEEGE